jgi:hypothetical protein
MEEQQSDQKRFDRSPAPHRLPRAADGAAEFDAGEIGITGETAGSQVRPLAHR